MCYGYTFKTGHNKSKFVETVLSLYDKNFCEQKNNLQEKTRQHVYYLFANVIKIFAIVWKRSLIKTVYI